MKKTVLSLALLAAGVASYAQISQGTIMLGGDIGFKSNGTSTVNSTTVPNATVTNPPDGSSSSFNLGLQGGYFVTDGMVVGLNVGFGSQTQGQTSNYTFLGNPGTLKWDNKMSSFNIGVFARKYMAISDKFYFYGGIGFDYMSGTISSSSPDNSTNPPTVKANPDGKFSGWDINIAPGLAFFPSPAWGIHFGLNNIIGYSSIKTTTVTNVGGNNTATQDVTNSVLSLGVGLTPTLGVAYFIGK